MEQVIPLFSLLATYGLTLILTEADGPFGVLYKLRHLKGLGALKCFVCTSVWVGALFALLTTQSALEFVIYALGYAGGAIVLHRLTERVL